MKGRILFACLFGLVAAGAGAQITVDVGNAKSVDDVAALAEHAARQFAANFDRATARTRAELIRAGTLNPRHPLSFPTTVWLAKNGVALPVSRPRGPRPRSSGLTLSFDPSGPRAFPPAYQAELQSIFNGAQATMTSVFGPPAVSGTVAVKDYNADISDRGFFAGGFYIPNTNPPEIHFPEYADDASIAVNFIHVLLLAYLGPDQYGFDAFNEGLVRAATMQIARTPAALPGIDQGAIAGVLDNTYDVGPWYDWYNQRALGGAQFVAPNLADQPLNNGVGGIWLLRYQMAGSAWLKLLIEQPSFISNFNAAFYANPSVASDVPSLVALAQTTLDTINPSSPTVEGMSFSDWFERQFILETKTTSGRKVLVQPVPVTNVIAGDFGPFDILINYFQTQTGGNEVLSGATCYPIFWEGDTILTRLFTSVQDEQAVITSGIGSVTPNLPDANSGEPYRGTIDIPVGDEIGRVYLPVGDIATGTNPTPNDFYGTVTGVLLQSGDTLRLQVTVGGASIPDVPVTSLGAFGTVIGTQAYLGNNTISVNVVRNNAQGDTVLYSRTIDKGPGPLALDLRVGSEADYTFLNGLPAGISTMGFPVDPFVSYNPDLVGSSTLIARYDPTTGAYALFPDAEPFKAGLGFFLNAETAQSPFTVSGRVLANIGGTVALRPGWNLVANPLQQTTTVDNMLSVHAADFPRFFTDAEGSDIGTVFYEFQPGENDPASGVPETGSMVPATSFVPGHAYFVQVFSPEGVTLVFDQASGPSQHTAVSRAAVRQNMSSWLMGVTLIDRRFKIGAQIGQDRTATSGFDRAEDAALPPSLTGGRQVSVTDIGSMYRDIRRTGNPDVYTVQVDGLKAGKTYALSFDRIVNSPGTFLLRRSNGSIVGVFKAGQQVDFTAQAPSLTLKIQVSGVVLP